MSSGMMIPGYSNYTVTEDGKVFSHFTDKFIYIYKTKSGYYAVRMTNDSGKKRTEFLHRVVCLAWNTKPDGCNVVRHLDNNKDNNHRLNLAWGTAKDNVNDKIRHGTKLIGTQIHNSKITEQDVRDIRYLYLNTDVTQKSLGIIYGMTQTGIGHIVNGRSWGWVK